MNRLAGLYLSAGVILVAVVFCGAFYAWHQETATQAQRIGVPPTAYNLMVVHANVRGCAACHSDLAADVDALVVGRSVPVLHGTFTTSYGIPMRVEDCMPCHGPSTPLPFASDIHSIHMGSPAFANMGGTCDSCHATVNDKFVLYDDETRFSLMNGITETPTPPFGR